MVEKSAHIAEAAISRGRRPPPVCAPGGKARAYREIVDRLDGCIAALLAARLFETAMLLRIAKLDLTARLNGISEYELERLSSWLPPLS